MMSPYPVCRLWEKTGAMFYSSPTPIEDLVFAPEEEQQVDIFFEPMGDSQQMAQAIVQSSYEDEPHIPCQSYRNWYYLRAGDHT